MRILSLPDHAVVEVSHRENEVEVVPLEHAIGDGELLEAARLKIAPDARMRCRPQERLEIHFSHLAEQVTPGSPLGQLLPRLQALFVARGASLHDAQLAALQIIGRLVQRQSYVLAIQDAFSLTVVIIVLAIISIFFIRGSTRGPAKPERIPDSARATTEHTDATRLEATVAG